jgi:hypothetical protein
LEFYQDNALIRFLRSESSKNFLVPEIGTWHLIYGDEENNPIWQFHVLDLSSIAKNSLWQIPKFNLINGIDLFVHDAEHFELKRWSDGNTRHFNSDSLFEYYLELNLVKRKNVRTKRFNKASSSVYHEWQMNQLFIGGVTDIDLYRMDDSGNIVELIEIKRSRISLNEWSPFISDKGGYEILQNLALKLGISFTTIYYEFDPRRGLENIDRLQIFKKGIGFHFQKLGVVNLKDFVSGDYLS